jgi:DNA-directed RNA polymerase subunit B'
MIGTSIYLNGRLVGFHQNPKELVQSVKERRRLGEFPVGMSIAYYDDLNEVYINADENRAMRPLIIVDKGKSKLTPEHLKLLRENKMKFSDLVKNGIIEFLDAEEEENSYIAIEEKELTEEHTHLEIHPTLILGVGSAVSPFAEHNSAPRIPMTSQMIKQALGMYALNFNLRTDTQSHVMLYPQVPIAQTKYTKIVGIDEKAAGQNFVIALMPYFGFNINDAIIINRGAIDRGLARTVYYRTYEAEERRYPGGQKDRFEKPKQETQGYRGEDAYKYLDEDGIIEPEFEIKAGDVLVGKTSPPRFLEEVSEFGVLEEKRRENSEGIKQGEDSIVDWVIITEGEGGNKLIKVRTRKSLIPEIGDKFAARHGQKGVIGLVVDERDMPFTEDGIIPDICVNPHAIPSRMTFGFLLECMGAKAGCLTGSSVDATPFDGKKREEIEQELHDYGFSPSGREALYNGTTGNRIDAQIFIGVIYYQRLKYLVSTKIRARARGPVQILTRQPTEGKSREGGLKFGEMERDCLIGHGTAMTLMERLLEESDKITELVCDNCGMLAVNDQIRKKSFCPVCGDSVIHPIEMSYAFKLLLNELKSMCVFPKLKLEDKV